MDTSMEQTISQMLTRARAIERAMHDTQTSWSIAPMGIETESGPVPADLEVAEGYVKWRSSTPWVASTDGEVEFYGLYADGDLVLVDRVPGGPLRLLAGDTIALAWTLRVVRYARH